jgi:hypothetical protein
MRIENVLSFHEEYSLKLRCLAIAMRKLRGVLDRVASRVRDRKTLRIEALVCGHRREEGPEGEKARNFWEQLGIILRVEGNVQSSIYRFVYKKHM